MSFSIPEGMSAFFRFQQPPEQRAQKRRRAQDVDSGGSTGGPRCRYHGCERPTREKGRGEFCGDTHKDFFMANLADMSDHVGAAGSSDGNKNCMLPGCDLPVRLDSTTGYTFDFCVLEHYHEYVKICTRQWHEKGRLCKLRGCSNHVWVEETTKKLYKFCGKTCTKRFIARREFSALAESPGTSDAARVDGKGPSGDKNTKEGTFQEAFEEDVDKLKNKHGYHDKDSVPKTYMEKCLKHLVLNPDDLATADPDGKLCTGIDISRRCPWEVVDWEGDEARYFLSWDDSLQSETERIINDAFVYRQSSKPHPGIVQAKYFSCQSRRKPHISKDGPDDPIWAFYQHDEAKKKERAREKKRGKKREEKKGKADQSQSRWRMRKFYLSDNAIKGLQSTGPLPRYRAEISMIFQDKEGKPDWTPNRQNVVETPAIDPITEAGNAGVSFGTIPNPVLPWGDMELDIAATWQDGTTLIPNSLNFDDFFPGFDQTVDYRCGILPRSEELF